MSGLYLDDFVPGRRFAAGTFSLSRDEIIAFATDFDPQPFHLDDAAAARSLFGRIAASGWHTASMVAGTLARGLGLDRAGGYRRLLGIEDLRWLRPVYPGEVLAVGATVLAVDPLSGTVDLGVDATAADGAPVCRCRIRWQVAARPAS